MSAGAVLHSTGYRPHDGPRTGVAGAMRSVTAVTLRHAMGIGRPARAKVFPILAIVVAYVPTLVFIGVAVLGNRLEREGAPGRAMADAFIPSYAGNYLQIVLAILVLAAFVAPEVLCPDRRTGMLGLYLAAPLNRTTYLLSKGAAVAAMLSVVTVGPPLLLLAGYASQGYGPVGLDGWLATVGRILAAGAVIAAVQTSVSLAVSSLTTRTAAASAGFLGLLVGVSGLVGFAVVSGGASPRWNLANLATLPYEATFRIFGEPSPLVVVPYEELPAMEVAAATAAWIVVSLLVVAVAYRRVEAAR